MHVLVYEPLYSGHRLDYVRHLVLGLRDLGVTTTLATSRAAKQSDEFQIHLEAVGDAFHLELVSIEPQPFATARSARALARELDRAVQRFRPDHVLVPGGDGLAQAVGLLSAFRRLPSLRDVPLQTLLFRGNYGYRRSWSDRLRQRLWLTAIQAGPWTRLFHLDPYQLLTLRETFHADARWNLMPDPVTAPTCGDRSQSREALGLPTDGKLLACAGGLNTEKGIPELLNAFEMALPRLPPTDRLVLAGPCAEDIRALIDRSYASLVASKRLHVLDGILSRSQMDSVFSAADVVCAPHRRAWQSSGIVLRGLAAGRMLLVSRKGWLQRTVDRFQLGLTTCTEDPHDFAEKIVEALRMCDAYQLSAQAQRLIEFHAPQNFVATWTAAIRHQMGKTADPALRTWEWVLEECEEGEV